MQLQFPDEHPVPQDLPLDELPPAPAPTLVPGPPPPSAPPAPDVPVQPWPAKKAGGMVGAVVAVVAIVAIVVVIVAVSGGRDGTPAASPDAGQIAETTADRTEEPVAPAPAPAPLDESGARQLLENQVAKDRPQVEALAESWAPQLSSKKPGLTANGTTFDYRAIWSDFTSLQERYPGALLLWSGDYSSFKSPDFWVTIAPQSFGTGEAANGWCDSAGIGKDDCFAKRITHTDGPDGNTKHRK